MSIINLGLQCVCIGLDRAQMDEEMEKLATKCGSMKEARKIADQHPGFKEAGCSNNNIMPHTPAQ